MIWAPLTFVCEAFFSEDADEGQEPGDLLQTQHSGVAELDDGGRLLIKRTAAPVLSQAAIDNTISLSLYQ